ncbi:OLC1v1014791C1 [Oldenlandia corymbosa var. corymbosa]|uniref:OLC1v1014791C1 n=1 Tax=Oldenlandia corymbosa var. corymbosa TaxID=529605 RepID=A0AAV1E5G9_OLDCO|nr:OLC1v1014791C1 [Oldenlandia corymbosa var. corymbosa]
MQNLCLNGQNHLLHKCKFSLLPCESSTTTESFRSDQPKFEKGNTALGFLLEEGGIVVAADHSSKLSKTPNIVTEFSHMLATISEEPLSIGILIAVWNQSEKGLNGDGEVIKGDVLDTGSGSGPAAAMVYEERGVSLRSQKRKPRMTAFHLGIDGCKKLHKDSMEEWYQEHIKVPRTRFEIIGKGW